MGRSEKPVDPDQGPLQRFAADLRELRKSAGSPTYRALADRAHYSAAALSQAAAGRMLPSRALTLAFVEACGGDAAAWDERWQQLAHQLGPQGPVVVADGPAPPDEAGDQPVPRRSRRIGALAAAGVAALVIVGGGATALAMSGRPPARAAAVPPSPSPSPSALAVWPNGPDQPVADGSDPKRSHCDRDVQTLDAADAVLASGVVAGDVELRYSPECRAAWARFTPTPSLPVRPTILVTVTTVRPADGLHRPFTVSQGGLAVIGDILLVAKGCVQAQVVLAEQGRQLATASTKCLTSP